MEERSVSPYGSEALTLKALTIIADHYEQIANEIKDLFRSFKPINYGDNLVGRVFTADDHTRVEFIPAESLKVKMDDGAIVWLQRDVLEKIREKHGWNYKVFDKNGFVSRIIIYGDLPDEKIEELKNPIGWAFSAASGLIGSLKKAEETGRDILERAERMFPNELLDKISLELTDRHVIVKTKQYLGSKLFRELAEIVRDKLGGEYVSAGRDSHFRIPIKAMQK